MDRRYSRNSVDRDPRVGEMSTIIRFLRSVVDWDLELGERERARVEETFPPLDEKGLKFESVKQNEANIQTTSTHIE